MTKFIKFFIFLNAFIFSVDAMAREYPFIDGSMLTQVQFDRVMSSKAEGVPDNNGFIYAESKFSLNFNKNWSLKTQWRFQPNNVLRTRDQENPERYRNFLQEDRGINIDNNGLLVEELKFYFENEDMAFQIGKFDPQFGVGHDKSKRMGIFTAQFNEDYNLREKLGASLSASLEDSKLSIHGFFNDTTGLSGSALNSRSRAERNDGLSGNTGTLSSYAIDLIGENLAGYSDWKYNIGYRSLSVDNGENRSREIGYVIGSEYNFIIGNNVSFVPFVEIVKIDNLSGESSRDALFTTVSFALKYRGWNIGVSRLQRSVDETANTNKAKDKQMQAFIGYKFSNNFTLDFTRSTITENGEKASMAGFMASYLYEF